MELDLIKSQLESQYPNGRYVHTIREKCMYIVAYIKDYLKTEKNSSLYIAAEYMKSLNKEIGSNITLYDIDEVAHLDILKQIYDWS